MANKPEKVAGGRFFYGWFIVLASFAAHLGEGGMLGYALGVFVIPFEEEFGWSRATIGGAVTLGTLGGALVSPFIGRIVDKQGPRAMMTWGGILLGAVLASLAFMQNLLHFYVLYPIGRGVALSSLGLGSTVAVANWFIIKRGRAMGIGLSGISLGGFLTPLISQGLIDAFGWRWAWIGLAIFAWVLIVPPSWIWVRHKPEDMGLRPDGLPPRGVNNDIPTIEKSSGYGQEEEENWTLGAALRTPVFWVLIVSVALASLAVSAIILHQIPHFRDIGIGEAQAASVLSVFALTNGVTRFLSGYVVERVSVRWCLPVTYFGSAVGMLLLAQVHDLSSAYLFAVVYGLAAGGVPTLSTVMWADYFGRQFIGTIRGSVAPFQMGAVASGPLIAGLVYDITGQYTTVFFSFVVTFTLAGLLMLTAKRPRLTRA